MIELTKYYYYLFGVMTIVGGVIGCLKGSAISLATAGPIGALIIFAGYLVSTRLQPALILGLLLSIALAGRFIPIMIKKGGFMPAGLMSALSVIGAVLTIITLIAAGTKR